MGISRYAFSPAVRGGSTIATSDVGRKIFHGIENGSIAFSSRILQEGERLEHIAAKAFGSADMWWAIAAASGIGWGLQCPPGTILRVPKNLGDILSLLR